MDGLMNWWEYAQDKQSGASILIFQTFSDDINLDRAAKSPILCRFNTPLPTPGSWPKPSDDAIDVTERMSEFNGWSKSMIARELLRQHVFGVTPCQHS